MKNSSMPVTAWNALLILSYLILKPPYGSKNDLGASSEISLFSLTGRGVPTLLPAGLAP